jgi:hypothetical protein
MQSTGKLNSTTIKQITNFRNNNINNNNNSWLVERVLAVECLCSMEYVLYKSNDNDDDNDDNNNNIIC